MEIHKRLALLDESVGQLKSMYGAGEKNEGRAFANGSSFARHRAEATILAKPPAEPPCLPSFYGILIRMYFFDAEQHRLPHIHAQYQGQQARLPLCNEGASTMNPHVTSAIPQANHRLLLEFANGEIRLFDLTPYLDKGVFRALRDSAEFAQVKIVDGSVEWPGEIDLSYDTLYLRSVVMQSISA